MLIFGWAMKPLLWLLRFQPPQTCTSTHTSRVDPFTFPPFNSSLPATLRLDDLAVPLALPRRDADEKPEDRNPEDLLEAVIAYGLEEKSDEYKCKHRLDTTKSKSHKTPQNPMWATKGGRLMSWPPELMKARARARVRGGACRFGVAPGAGWKGRHQWFLGRRPCTMEIPCFGHGWLWCWTIVASICLHCRS